MVFREKSIAQVLADKMNDYRIEKKLRILYICCVLCPLIITDSVIIALVFFGVQKQSNYELMNISSAVKYNLTSTVEQAVTVANSVYTNRYISNFLNHQYKNGIEYYSAYQDFVNDTLIVGSFSTSKTSATMYADNATIINGSVVKRLDKTVCSQVWYRQMVESGNDRVLSIYFDNVKAPETHAKRKISLIRKLNYYQHGHCEKILKLDIDYSGLVTDIIKNNYDAPVYVCYEGKVILSNKGHSSIGRDFETFNKWDKVGSQETFHLYGSDITIYVLKKEESVLQLLKGNLSFIFFLICMNAILPWSLMRMINRSFTGRLRELSDAFNCVDDEKMQEVSGVRGNDEIGVLMKNYNRMATRMNDLIQTVYKDKLKEQEINISRQKAELLALHSQINPHFLFNALESIRMHSVLKDEMETARMVEKLALIERQYIDWGTDYVEIQEEIELVEAYLELQRYRFGARLCYRLEVEEGCGDYTIPRLTIVTFVENACVHGVENKSTQGWVFVRIFLEGDMFCMEIEDTGRGIEISFLEELRENMSHAGIASLRKKNHIGIMNACLRIRMMTKDNAHFEIESEKGAGTIVTVKIPIAVMKKS